MKTSKNDRSGLSVAPRGNVAVALIVCLACIATSGVGAQYAGIDWGVALRHQSASLGEGDGASLASVDSLRLFGEVYQRAGRLNLTYRIGGGLVYSAQQDNVFTDTGRETIVYAGRSGFELLRVPEVADRAWLGAEIGRIALSDPFGVLFSDPQAREQQQLADGLTLNLRRRRLFVSLSAGYLGWLDKSVNRVRMTVSEQIDLYEPGDWLAQPRGVAVGRVEVDDLWSRQDAGLLLVAQQDFDDSDDPFDVPLSSYYGGLFVSGPFVVAGLDHQTMSILAYSVTDDTELAGVSLLIRNQFTYALSPTWIDSARFAFEFASGGESLAPFPALAGPDVSVALAEQLSDVVVFELGTDASYSIPPASATVRPDVALRLFLVPSGTPTSTGIETDGVFGGFEIAPSVSYRPIRGLDVAARAGFLFGETQRNVIRFEGRLAL